MINAHPDDSRPPSPLRPLRAVAGRVKRSLSRSLDHALHPARRRRAEAHLRSLTGVRRVLFLCLGNVCRSPYAEARFRARMGGSVEVGSAGFIGPGRAPPQEALDAASARGIDTSDHRSRLVTSTLLAEAELVVVMDSRQLRRVRRLPGDYHRGPVILLGDLDPSPIHRRAIRDPWGDEGWVFDAVFERIDRCVDELAENLQNGVDPRAPHASGHDPSETDRGARPWSRTTSR